MADTKKEELPDNLAKLTVEELQQKLSAKDMGLDEKRKILEKILLMGTESEQTNTKIKSETQTKITKTPSKTEQSNDATETKMETTPKARGTLSQTKDSKIKEEEWENAGKDFFPRLNHRSGIVVPLKGQMTEDYKAALQHNILRLGPLVQEDFGNSLLEHYVGLASKFHLKVLPKGDDSSEQQYDMLITMRSTEDRDDALADLPTIKEGVYVDLLDEADCKRGVIYVNKNPPKCNPSPDEEKGQDGQHNRKKSILLNGLPNDATEDELEAFYPTAMTATIMKKPFKENAGQALIEFVTPAEALQAYQENREITIRDTTVKASYFFYQLVMYNRNFFSKEDIVRDEILTPKERSQFIKVLRAYRKYQTNKRLYHLGHDKGALESRVHQLKMVFVRDNQLRAKRGLPMKALPDDLQILIYGGATDKIPADVAYKTIKVTEPRVKQKTEFKKTDVKTNQNRERRDAKTFQQRSTGQHQQRNMGQQKQRNMGQNQPTVRMTPRDFEARMAAARSQQQRPANMASQQVAMASQQVTMASQQLPGPPPFKKQRMGTPGFQQQSFMGPGQQATFRNAGPGLVPVQQSMMPNPGPDFGQGPQSMMPNSGPGFGQGPQSMMPNPGQGFKQGPQSMMPNPGSGLRQGPQSIPPNQGQLKQKKLRAEIVKQIVKLASLNEDDDAQPSIEEQSWQQKQPREREWIQYEQTEPEYNRPRNIQGFMPPNRDRNIREREYESSNPRRDGRDRDIRDREYDSSRRVDRDRNIRDRDYDSSNSRRDGRDRDFRHREYESSDRRRAGRDRFNNW